MRLFLLHVKEILLGWPLLALLLVCQLLFGYMASYALSDRTPELRLAVFTADHGLAADKFMSRLAAVPELVLIETESAAEAEAMAHRQEALAAVIVDEGLDARVRVGRNAVRFISAPSLNSGRVVREYVSAALIDLRAEERFRREMDGLGVDAPDLTEVFEPVLSVEYEGPPLIYDLSGVTPGYGIPALFVLVLSLYGAFFLPGPDRRRLLIRGRAVVIKDYFAGLGALLLVWFVLILVFFAGSCLVYGSVFDRAALLTFAALCLYCGAMGGLVAALGLRRAALWLFIPWLVLNMTLGGGLWGLPFSSPVLRPILPLESVLLGCGGYMEGAVFLGVMGLVFMVISVVALGRFSSVITTPKGI